MQIFWLDLHETHYCDFFSKICKFKKKYAIFTPNPEILLTSLKDPEFKTMLQKADILIPDGIGLYLAAQIINEKRFFLSVIKLPYFIYRILFEQYSLSQEYGDKICGSDLTDDLLHFAEEKWIHITILDPHRPHDEAKQKAQKRFKKDLKNIFPKLKFDFYIYKEEEKKQIVKDIRDSKSTILFSTLWMKKQEQSILEIMKKCENIKLWLGIGSSFDYFIGFQKRAPKIFRDFWIEWLYRIFTWPQKIQRIQRLWNAIFVFTWEVYKRK